MKQSTRRVLAKAVVAGALLIAVSPILYFAIAVPIVGLAMCGGIAIAGGLMWAEDVLCTHHAKDDAP